MKNDESRPLVPSPIFLVAICIPPAFELDHGQPAPVLANDTEFAANEGTSNGQFLVAGNYDFQPSVYNCILDVRSEFLAQKFRLPLPGGRSAPQWDFMRDLSKLQSSHVER